jgi:putative FmdB family regulatory protein
MPLYEYQCDQCGRFEVIRKFSDAPLTTCPTCGKPIEKLLSSPAIQFKGSGWYITDYARKSSGGSNKDGGKEGKSEGGTAESGKTESSTESGSKSKADVAVASPSTGSGKSGSDKS